MNFICFLLTKNPNFVFQIEAPEIGPLYRYLTCI